MEHVFDGRMTPTEHHALISLLALADASSGTWRGSAPALTTILGYSSKNTMANALDELEAKGYILRDFAPGRRGNFPIIIDKFEITRGAETGKRIDIAASKRKFGIPEGRLGKLTRKPLLGLIAAACRNPVLVLETDDGVDGGVHRGVRSSTVSRLENGEERRSEGGSEAPASITVLDRGFAVRQETASGVLFHPEYEDGCRAPSSVRSVQSQAALCGAPSAFSAAPTPNMSAPEQLATQFFVYQGRPLCFNTPATFRLWVSTFDRLIQHYGADDLRKLMMWAFEQDSFWPRQLIRPNAPLSYFEKTLEKGVLISRYLGDKTSEANSVKARMKTKEGNYDQQQHRPTVQRTGKQAVDNAAAAEEVKRRLNERLGG